MLSPEDSREALIHLFRDRRLVDLKTLFRVLRTGSRMSVFRRLKELEYLTSYSHTGRYYTLAAVPDFDPDGLWQCRGVLFSRHGSLKPTLQYLIDRSEDGRTHEELRRRLRVRVHNALLHLVRRKQVGRETVGRVYLYVTADAPRAAVQVARRRAVSAAEPVPPEPSAPLRIEVLLEVIHGAASLPEPRLVSERLSARGVAVTTEQVEAIFQAHGLKKTARSRSRPSRR